eukprot:COSAG01_NODE_10675_length_2107_cov_7.007968_1_plen_154_part_01
MDLGDDCATSSSSQQRSTHLTAVVEAATPQGLRRGQGRKRLVSALLQAGALDPALPLRIHRVPARHNCAPQKCPLGTPLLSLRAGVSHLLAQPGPFCATGCPLKTLLPVPPWSQRIVVSPTSKGVIRRRGSSNRAAVATVTALRDSGGGMLPVR